MHIAYREGITPFEYIIPVFGDRVLRNYVDATIDATIRVQVIVANNIRAIYTTPIV